MSGTLTHSYQYSPFGEKLAQSESTHNPLRFAARELDTQTGMYYVRARWYDPFLGRFLSEDPIGLAGGINPYAYAGNDPVNFTDPTGLQRECIIRGYHNFRRVGDGPWEYTGTEITYMYCTQDEDGNATSYYTERVQRPAWCKGGFDAFQCQWIREAIDRLQEHRLDYCRKMGVTAQRRFLRGYYHWNPDLPYHGWADLYDSKVVVQRGRPGFEPLAPGYRELVLQTTIAEEEAHFDLGSGHRRAGTFHGVLSPLGGPDDVGDACREGGSLIKG